MSRCCFSDPGSLVNRKQDNTKKSPLRHTIRKPKKASILHKPRGTDDPFVPKEGQADRADVSAVMVGAEDSGLTSSVAERKPLSTWKSVLAKSSFQE